MHKDDKSDTVKRFQCKDGEQRHIQTNNLGTIIYIKLVMINGVRALNFATLKICLNTMFPYCKIQNYT